MYIMYVLYIIEVDVVHGCVGEAANIRLPGNNVYYYYNFNMNGL